MEKEYIILFSILSLYVLYVCITTKNKEGFDTSIPSDQINSNHLANTIPNQNNNKNLNYYGNSNILNDYIEKAIPRRKPVILRSNYHPSSSKENAFILDNKIIYDPPIKSFQY